LPRLAGVTSARYLLLGAKGIGSIKAILPDIHRY
jgi:hypothetical protein